MQPFLAFDTETATYNGEICAIAAVLFEDGEPTQTWCTLVNPGVPIYWGFTQIHGIRNADVRDAPAFAQAWESLRPQFAGGLPVVAHNARFDHGVLKRNLEMCGLPFPEFALHCTLAMSRALWPQLPNHKLNTVAAHLGVELNHHEALSDALAAGHIAAAALRTWGSWVRSKP